jgi:glutamate synthase domain-containing protein 3
MKTINAKSKDLAEVNKALREALNGDVIEVKNAKHLHGLAAGFKRGEVVVQGGAGDYLAVLNAGATIRVTKDVGKYAADNMTGGVLIIEGNADYGVGQYCYGGTVVVHGNAGDFTATMNKGATIIVNGDVGDEAGTYMLAGDLIVVGNAGESFGNYLIHGDVYIGGEWKSLGHNTKVAKLGKRDVKKLKKYFDAFGLDADPEGFKKLVAASEKPFYH